MKKIILFGLTVMLLLTVFSSCKKEEHVTTTTEKIQQKWSVVNIKVTSQSSGVTVVLRSNPDQDFMEFRTDWKVLTYVNSESDISDYYVLNDYAISIDGETYDISNLSKTTLTISKTEETDSGIVTMTFELMNLK